MSYMNKIFFSSMLIIASALLTLPLSAVTPKEFAEGMARFHKHQTKTAKFKADLKALYTASSESQRNAIFTALDTVVNSARRLDMVRVVGVQVQRPVAEEALHIVTVTGAEIATRAEQEDLAARATAELLRQQEAPAARAAAAVGTGSGGGAGGGMAAGPDKGGEVLGKKTKASKAPADNKRGSKKTGGGRRQRVAPAVVTGSSNWGPAGVVALTLTVIFMPQKYFNAISDGIIGFLSSKKEDRRQAHALPLRKYANGEELVAALEKAIAEVNIKVSFQQKVDSWNLSREELLKFEAVFPLFITVRDELVEHFELVTTLKKDPEQLLDCSYSDGIELGFRQLDVDFAKVKERWEDFPKQFQDDKLAELERQYGMALNNFPLFRAVIAGYREFRPCS